MVRFNDPAPDITLKKIKDIGEGMPVDGSLN